MPRIPYRRRSVQAGQRVGIFVGFIPFASSSDSSEFRGLAGIGVKKAQAALHPGPEVRLPRERREHGVLRLAASEVYCVARPVKDDVVPLVEDHGSVVAVRKVREREVSVRIALGKADSSRRRNHQWPCRLVRRVRSTLPVRRAC